MDTISVGKLTKAANDATNIVDKVQDANSSLRLGDVASATSILASIAAANFPKLTGITSIVIITAVASITDGQARLTEAIRQEAAGNDEAIDAALSIVGVLGSLTTVLF